MEEFREKRKELSDRLSEIESASDDAWESLKQGLESSWEKIKSSFSHAKSDFERGYKEGRES